MYEVNEKAAKAIFDDNVPGDVVALIEKMESNLYSRCRRQEYKSDVLIAAVTVYQVLKAEEKANADESAEEDAETPKRGPGRPRKSEAVAKE